MGMRAWSNEEWVGRAREGRLDAGERAEFERLLAAGGELSALWELERRLDEALGQVQAVEPSSNFTSRVLAEIRRGEAAAERPQASGSRAPSWPAAWLRRWRAAAAFAVCGVVLGVWGLQERRHRAETALDLSAMATVASTLAPAGKAVELQAVVLEDFDTIRRLASLEAGSMADNELLAALQTR
jgi:hypothetical protein